MAKELKMYSNSDRFLFCYNKLDKYLRVKYSFKNNSVSYTEAVRRAARLNPIIQKYDDVLIDYGRLRNAIVHSNSPEMAIAEPHLKVVENYEKITKLICTPPKALDELSNEIVGCIEHDMHLKDVLEFGFKSGFSNLPVFKNGMLIGVSNGQKLADVIGKKIYEKVDIQDYIEKTKIGDVIKEFSNKEYYTVVNKDATVDSIINIFSQKRKLLLVLITKSGGLNEPPLGIITVSDVINYNEFFDA